MKELQLNEVQEVSGGGLGAVGSCVAGGSLGLRAGSYLGAWGAVGGAALGCFIGVGLYYLP